MFAYDADKGEHCANDVCDWFGDGSNTLHASLMQAMAAFLQESNSTEATVDPTQVTFPSTRSKDPFRVPLPALFFREPATSWPLLMDYFSTCQDIISAGQYDVRREPANVYPTDYATTLGKP
eukprot:1933516-Heterocapsa_arctica.AAC.1